VAKRCGRGTNENQAAAQSLRQLHQRCWSLRLSCWQPFTIVLNSEAAIPCASLSDRLENTFCATWNNKLSEVSLFLREKPRSSPAPGQKMLAGGPNLGTVNLFAACAGLRPGRPRIKIERTQKGAAFRPYVKCFAMNSALAAEGCLLLAFPGLPWETALFPQTL
jgi:hypothetical protein